MAVVNHGKSSRPAIEEVKSKSPEEAAIRGAPIKVAFALLPVQGHPGMYRDVVLHGVYAEEIEFLDSGRRPSKAAYGMERIAMKLKAMFRKGEL